MFRQTCPMGQRSSRDSIPHTKSLSRAPDRDSFCRRNALNSPNSLILMVSVYFWNSLLTTKFSLVSLTFPAVKNTCVITDSASIRLIRQIPRVCALHLTFEWELGFVYCHSRSTRALNEDPRSNLCETWAHSSWAADTRLHLLLVKTLSKWFMLKYSSWTRVPRRTFIKWMLKALPVTYAERNWHPHMYVPQFFEGFHTEDAVGSKRCKRRPLLGKQSISSYCVSYSFSVHNGSILLSN